MEDGQIDVKSFMEDSSTSEEHFLDEPQDARGLPLSYCREYEEKHKDWQTGCGSIYDYDSIPDVVVTDGDADWELCLHCRIIMV